MKKFFLLLILALLVTACHSLTHIPGPELNQDNFRVLKHHASAQQAGFKLLGIIPIMTPSRARAEAAIFRSLDEDLEGRPVALANKVEERVGIYLILFSIPILTTTADIIEFTGPAAVTEAQLLD